MMTLKIFLPNQLLYENRNVTRIIGETREGEFGILPRRRDCLALLVPGILTYEDGAGGEQYVAVDEGVLIKAEASVWISVRNAVTGGNLGELRKLVEERFLEIDERERKTRAILARMESDIIRQTRSLHDV